MKALQKNLVALMVSVSVHTMAAEHMALGPLQRAQVVASQQALMASAATLQPVRSFLSLSVMNF